MEGPELRPPRQLHPNDNVAVLIDNAPRDSQPLAPGEVLTSALAPGHKIATCAISEGRTNYQARPDNRFCLG